MKRKRLSGGEIRFRVSRADKARLADLLRYTDYHTISSMLRAFIAHAHEQIANEMSAAQVQESLNTAIVKLKGK